MEEDYPPNNTCEKTNHYCDKLQYGETSFLERLKMQFHLLFCPSCRAYSKRNSKLTETIEKSKVSSLNPREIETIKRNLSENQTG